MSVHLIIIAALALVHSQISFCAVNESGSYLKMDRGEFFRKNYRFINFNTEGSGDVTVELAFNVPFLTIPTKKAMNVTKGALATINVGGLVLGGALVIGAGIAIPAIYHLLVAKGSVSSKAERSEDTKRFLWDQLGSKIQTVLLDNELDSTACVQRVACWLVKNSSTKVSKGIGSSGDKILDGVVSNGWFESVLEDSVLYHPVKLGQNGGSCAKEYPKCKISQRSLQGVMKDIVKNVHF